MDVKSKPVAWVRWVKLAGLVLMCLISAAVGGGMSRTWGATQYQISYSDYISIMLTAVSLLVTILGIVLAVLGVIGWSSIETKVHQKAEDYLDSLRPEMLKRAEEAIREKAPVVMYEGVVPFDNEVDDNHGGGLNESSKNS